MYCKKCKTLLQKDSHICPKCGLDNDTTMDLNDLARKIKKQKYKNFLPIIILFIFIICVLISTFLIKDSLAIADTEKITISTTTKTTLKVKELKFEDIILEYPDNFGNSANTIFYKNNTQINVNITTITADEYNNLINGNDCLDSKIGLINTKTFAEKNYYSHLFMINNKYYNITVNYIEDLNIYNEKVQLDIAKIINSIKEK